MIEQKLDDIMCAIGLQKSADELNGSVLCGSIKRLALPLLEAEFEDMGVNMHPGWKFRILMAKEVDSIIGKSQWITNYWTTCHQAITATLTQLYGGAIMLPPAEHQGWIFPTPQQEAQWRNHRHKQKLERITLPYRHFYGSQTDDKDNS